MGGDRYWSHLVHDFARVEPGMRVLDVGCGPARVIEHLPEGVDYVGVDHNGLCIRQAERRFGSRGRFICTEASLIGELGGAFDAILAMGLLHHLEDREALAMLEGAGRLLSPSGKLITADVVDVPDATTSAAWLLARDRGDYVRDASGYGRLIGRCFDAVSSSVSRDLLRVPFTGAPFPLLLALAAAPVAARAPRRRSPAPVSAPRELAPLAG